MDIKAKPLLFIFLALGLLWLRSSLAKFASGNFVSGLGTTLSKVVDKNPYPWYKQFLNTVAIPNSQIFGSLVLWGELLTALAIIFGSVMFFTSKAGKFASLVLMAGLAGGFFLNIIFWLGFGYTSPSTDSLNLLMGVIEIVGLVVLTKGIKNINN